MMTAVFEAYKDYVRFSVIRQYKTVMESQKSDFGFAFIPDEDETGVQAIQRFEKEMYEMLSDNISELYEENGVFQISVGGNASLDCFAVRAESVITKKVYYTSYRVRDTHVGRRKHPNFPADKEWEKLSQTPKVSPMKAVVLPIDLGCPIILEDGRVVVPDYYNTPLGVWCGHSLRRNSVFMINDKEYREYDLSNGAKISNPPIQPWVEECRNSRHDELNPNMSKELLEALYDTGILQPAYIGNFVWVSYMGNIWVKMQNNWEHVGPASIPAEHLEEYQLYLSLIKL